MYFTSLPIENLTKEQCDGSIIRENLQRIQTGDVLLLNRNCFRMKELYGISLCFLNKVGSRFDHAGLLLKLNEDEKKRYLESLHTVLHSSPSNTYVMEANIKGVTVYPLEERLARSSAHEIAFSSLHLEKDSELKRQKILAQLPFALRCPYPTDFRTIIPCVLNPPDKLDRMQAAGLVRLLDGEICFLSKWATKKRNPTLVADVKEVCRLYKDAQERLLSLYFPLSAKKELVSEKDAFRFDCSNAAFAVDGANHADKMVCSEIISNIWTAAGITTGYLPASSQRPFDFFLLPLRLSFVEPTEKLVSFVPLKVNQFFSRYWVLPKESENKCTSSSSSISYTLSSSSPDFSNENETASSLWERTRIDFIEKAFGKPYSASRSLEEAVQQLAAASRCSEIASVQESFLAQSTPARQLHDLPFRYFCSVVLVSFVQFACAPWTLRWMEAQAGSFIVRGNMWSLAGGMLLHNMISAAMQCGIIAGVLSHYSQVASSEILLSEPLGMSTIETLVDTRNPFYSMVAAVWFSSLLSWMLTTPMRTSNFYRHFVHRLPGPIPFRHYCSGMFSLLPMAIVLPYSGFWLNWYETVGAFVFPMRSSVWRPHDELLKEQKKSSWHKTALFTAVAAIITVDTAVYSVDTYVKRRSLQRVYGPHSTPRCFGKRSLYAGFRYRFYSTSLQCAASLAFFSYLGLV